MINYQYQLQTHLRYPSPYGRYVGGKISVPLLHCLYEQETSTRIMSFIIQAGSCKPKDPTPYLKVTNPKGPRTQIVGL